VPVDFGGGVWETHSISVQVEGMNPHKSTNPEIGFEFRPPKLHSITPSEHILSIFGYQETEMSKKNETVEILITRFPYSEGLRVSIEPNKHITKCTIRFDWELLAFGIGVLKHGDAYDRELGCRMALKSALKMLNRKDVNADIWAEYLKIFPVSERKPAQKKLSNSLFAGLTRCGVSYSHDMDAYTYLLGGKPKVQKWQ